MSAHFVYIIYSESFDRFYVGETVNVEERLRQHNTGFYNTSSTIVAGTFERGQLLVRF